MPAPSAAVTSGGSAPDWNAPVPAPLAGRFRRLRLGGRPSAGDSARGSGHLRNACARFHPSSVIGTRRRGGRNLLGHAGEDPLSEGVGRQLRRADADLRVRRIREQPLGRGTRNAGPK